MSSFKRKSAPKQTSRSVGIRTSPSSPSTIITSTGIPSLDDILGGGLPLSCSLLVLAPDAHSAYGELVQKYFIAQGLACGQRVCVIADDAKEFVKECMWLPANYTGSTSPRLGDDEEEEHASQQDEKIKIAWRYDQMKKFQTTVSSSTPYVSLRLYFGRLMPINGVIIVFRSAEEYCRTLDLTCRIPETLVEDAIRLKELQCVDLASEESGEPLSTLRIISQIAWILKTETLTQPPSEPLRICIPSFASPQWGDLHNQVSFISPKAVFHMENNSYRTYCSSSILLDHSCASIRIHAHLFR
jgi:elongator complex protein 4